MKTYRDCECGAYRIKESGQPCEVCKGCEGRLESLRGELDLAHKFHDVAVAERERLMKKLEKIENLSKHAWEQVDSAETQELFRMIYEESK